MQIEIMFIYDNKGKNQTFVFELNNIKRGFEYESMYYTNMRYYICNLELQTHLLLIFKELRDLSIHY